MSDAVFNVHVNFLDMDPVREILREADVIVADDPKADDDPEQQLYGECSLGRGVQSGAPPYEIKKVVIQVDAASLEHREKAKAAISAAKGSRIA